MVKFNYTYTMNMLTAISQYNFKLQKNTIREQKKKFQDKKPICQGSHKIPGFPGLV